MPTTPSRQGIILAITTTDVVVTVVFTFIRVWGNIIVPHRKLCWDDFCAYTASLLSLVVAALLYVELNLGLGRHTWEVSLQDLVGHTHIQWIGLVIWAFLIASARFSVIFMYENTIRGTNRGVIIALWILSILNVGWLTLSISAAVLECQPAQKTWSGDLLPEGSCFPLVTWNIITNVASLVIDIGLISLPVSVIHRVKTDFRKKPYIVAMFACGFTIVAVTLGRLTTVVRTPDNAKVDSTWILVPLRMWTLAEGPIFIACLSLPALNRLTKHGRSHGMSSLFNFSARADGESLRGESFSSSEEGPETMPRTSNSLRRGLALGLGTVSRWRVSISAGDPSCSAVAGSKGLPIDRIHVHREISVEKDVSPV